MFGGNTPNDTKDPLYVKRIHAHLRVRTRVSVCVYQGRCSANQCLDKVCCQGRCTPDLDPCGIIERVCIPGHGIQTIKSGELGWSPPPPLSP